MSTESIQIIPDPWLAAVLERDSFRIVLGPDCSSLSVRSKLKILPPAFYYAKVSTSNIQLSAGLQHCGFAVVDVNVTFERSGINFCHNESDICIRPFDATRHSDVPRIAETCFRFSRFHLDPQMTTEAANRIKRTWVENYISGKRGDRLWICEWRGITTGFICELHSVHHGTPIRLIDLVGIDQHYQRRGLGRSLVEHVLKEAGANRVRVGTQVANVPSIRLYEQCGFRFVESSYVLHAHIT